jgi:hypothetical protein
MNKNLIVCTVTCMLFFSCSDPNSPGSFSGTVKPFQASYDYIANPDNPYNDWGRIHNAALDWIAERAQQARPVDSPGWFQLVAEFFHDSAWSYVKDAPMDGPLIASIHDSGEYYFDYLLNNCQSDIHYYLSSINTALQDTSLTFSAMIDHISIIETSIIADGDLSDTARTFPLAFVAVAKYSLAYWKDTSNYRIWSSFCTDSTLFTGRGSLSKPVKGEPETSKAYRIVREDAVYAAGTAVGAGVVGALAGALFGTPAAGPLGATAGGVAGAASGFILGSASGISVGAAASAIKFIKEHSGGGK